MRPTVVFPARYFLGGREVYYALAGLPPSVLPVVEPLAAERSGYRGECLVDDFSDLPRLLARLDACAATTGRRFVGVLAIDDEDQYETARAIARHLGAAFHADSTLSIASNKFLLKRRFVRFGVPTGNFLLLTESTLPAAEVVGFPSVLKTLTGNDSEYVFVNRGPDALAENVRRLAGTLSTLGDDPRYREIVAHVRGERPRFDTRREFLLEEFLEGDEFSCDFSIHDGRVQVLRLAKKLRGATLGSFRGFHLMNERSATADGLDPATVHSLCVRIARALGVTRGVQMVDLIQGPDGPRVLESSIRPGLGIFIGLMHALYGYTSPGVAGRLLAGDDVSVTIPEVEGIAVYLFADRPGTIRRIDVSGLDALRGEIEPVDVWLYGKPGDTVAAGPRDSYDLVQGYVLARLTGRSHPAEVAARIWEACRIEMEGDPD